MTFDKLLSDYEALHKNYDSLKVEYEKACQQLTWFRRQMFGKKSERHVPTTDSAVGQQPLFPVKEDTAVNGEQAAKKEEGIKVKGYTRKKGSSGDGSQEEELPEGTFPEHLRREDEVIDDKPEGVSEDDLEIDSEKVTERLAEKPGEHYVIRTSRKIYKLKETGEFINSAVVPQPLGRCKVDISFVVLLVIRKFMWALPLYRQHQALKLEGIKLDRASFAHWVIKLAKLLRPIAEALKRELLLQYYLHIDETPAQVGRGKKKKGKKFEVGYYWPFLHPEIGVYFEFRRTKSYQELKAILEGYRGTIVSGAAEVYQNFVRDYQVRWQLCWQHIRRYFFDAKVSNEARAEEALGYKPRANHF